MAKQSEYFWLKCMIFLKETKYLLFRGQIDNVKLSISWVLKTGLTLGIRSLKIEVSAREITFNSILNIFFVSSAKHWKFVY